MGIYAIKPKFQKVLRPVENLFVKYKVHPTYVNIIGFGMSILAAMAVLGSETHNWWLLVVPVAANARTACNALDGLVARRLGVADRFGEVLNETIDRVNDAAIFAAVYFLDVTRDGLALCAIIIILINSYLSIVSKAAGGSRQYGGIVGKADRMIYLSLAAVLVFFTGNEEIWNYFLWFIAITTTITFIQRYQATRHELQSGKA